MRSKAIFRQSLYLSHPDLTPIAGFFLALASFILLSYSPPEPRRGIVLLKETPYVHGNACSTNHIVTETIISLAADGHVSFAITDTALQIVVLKQVGKLHAVGFTASQVTALGALPYLATTIGQVPSVLTRSRIAYRTQVLAQRNSALTLLQLAECALASKLLATSITGSPTSFLLFIGAEADASKVMKLMGALQERGINHFYLLSHNH